MDDAVWSYSGVDSGDWASGEEEPLPSQAEAPQGQFGRYRIEEELGRGGMGVVYRAFDPTLKRDVALKVVLQKDLPERRRKRFVREGELTALLDHPGIVGVHSAGEIDGLLYLAYELVEGCRTLEEAFAERSLAERAELVVETGRALGIAHRQGIVHRDVKPANVLVTGEGAVKVADFGLASAQGLERLTQTGAMVGTPTHMAPEQLDPKREVLAPPTDVWGLGVILYEALTGALPFEGESLLELGAQIVSGEVRPPSQRAKGVSASLDAVCLKALMPWGRERYPDGVAFADDLERALRGQPVQASRTSTITRLRVLARRTRRAQWALAVAAVLAAAGGSVYSFNQRASGDVAASMANNELRLRSRKLDQATRQALRSGASIASEERILAALEAELAALRAGAAAPGAEVAGRLDLCARRLSALRVLQRLDAGSHGAADGAYAWLQAKGDESPALRDAVAGARAVAQPSVGGQPLDRADQVLIWLESAIEGGIGRPELRGWRALARQAVRPANDKAAARASLEDLKALASARIDGLDRTQSELRASLHLALGQVPEAALVARALGDPASAVAHRVRYAEAGLLLDENQELAARDLLAEVPLRLDVAVEERVALGLRCGIRCRELVELDPFPVERALALAQALRLLYPDEAVSMEIVRPLIDYVVVKNTRSFPLGPAIAALRPDDFAVHEEIAKAGVRDESDETSRIVRGVALRALELAPTPMDKARSQLNLAGLYKELRRHEEIINLTTQALRVLTDQRLISRAYELRAGALWSGRQDAEGALRDLASGSREFSGRQSNMLTLRVQIFLHLGRRDDALDCALRYLRVSGSVDSAKFAGTLANAWDLARALDRPADLGEQVDRFLGEYPYLGGWRLRRAWLHLRAGDAAAARDALRRGAAELRRHPPVEGKTAANGALEAAAALAPRFESLVDRVGEDPEGTRGRLEALLDELDRIRSKRMVP